MFIKERKVVSPSGRQFYGWMGLEMCYEGTSADRSRRVRNTMGLFCTRNKYSTCTPATCQKHYAYANKCPNQKHSSENRLSDIRVVSAMGCHYTSADRKKHFTAVVFEQNDTRSARQHLVLGKSP